MKQPLRALLIEDNVDDAALLVRVLWQGDYEPTWERVDSPAGLQAALTHRTWDIVISDYAMPQFDGLTALRMVKNHDGNLPFVLVSGTVGEDIAVAAMRAGANDYVMKDRPSRLLPAIARELHEADEHRKQQAAQKALAQSEERFRSFMRHFPGLAYIKDVEGRTVFANEGFAAYLGMDPASVLGKTNYELFPSKFADKIARDDREILVTGRSANVEECFAGRTWATYKFSIAAGGATPFLAGFTLDVTERKRAEERIREQAGLLDLIFAHSLDCVVLLDKDYNFIRVNDAYARACQRPVADFPGHNHFEFYPSTLKEEFDEALRKGDVYRSSARPFVIPDHPERGVTYWDLGLVPIRNTDGTIKLLLFTLKDVSEQKRLIEQFQQAQKMESIGQLAGGVAHDFNNMLQAILGYTELLLGQTPAGDERRPDLLEIQQTGRRAANLTRQLLAFARKQTIAPKAIDLNAAIEGMLKMLRRLIGEHIEFVWTPGASLWPVWMDPAQIDQILANLLVNSRDAIGGQGRITIATGNQTLDSVAAAGIEDAASGDYAVLSVIDTGCGMTRETLAHIFEPFFTTKGVGQGTGLGLATVYGIVKQNNGFITVQSEPDRGTTFRVHLPRHGDPAGPAPARNPMVHMPRGRGEVLLLVEDELTILNLGRRLLEHLGYTVVAASTPMEALRLAGERAGEIHLLVTDVIMPELSGRELSRQLLLSRPEIKSLFMSGYTAEIIARQGVLEEGLNFLQKPFNIEGLAVKVRQALDGR